MSPKLRVQRPRIRAAVIFCTALAMLVSLASLTSAQLPLPSPLPLPPPPPLPLPPPPPLPLPLPLPLPGLSLGPPELPKIPSLPQVIPPNAPPPSGTTQLPVTNARLDAKILIVSADGTEPVLGSIRQAADYEGVPYTLYIASQHPGGFTPSLLSDGDRHAFYQGIVLTTGTLAWNSSAGWTSAFNSNEWQTLWDYQARYRVRTVIAYAYPTTDLGYGTPTGVDASASPISTQLTSSGRSVYSYVNASNPITITNAWTYLAAPSGAGNDVLLSDAQNHALSLVHTYPDGRQVMSNTFDGNFFLVHSLTLAHGMVNWVTGGLFVGERHVYIAPQIDDIFIDDDLYGGGTYRITGTDWAAVTAWQAQKQLQSQTANLSLHMAFNGQGTTGTYFPDGLTPAATATNSQFPWINHTFSHENLDSVSYSLASQEITKNNQTASSMGLQNFDRRAIVTPDISGLYNTNAMRAAYDAGIRFLVTDTSRPGMDNPRPQQGIRNWKEPRILMVPRRPVNLFYNVTTPSQWMGQYNALYRTYWGRDLTYAEILGKESDVLLQYLLRGEVDPWMFHQTNLRAYDGVHTLLGDLLDLTLQKYERIFTLPVRSLTLAGLGEWTSQRMASDTAGVQCSFVPESGTMTITAARDAVVPVTGLCTESSENYGGQCISHVRVAAGQTVSLQFPPVSSARSTAVAEEVTPRTESWLAPSRPNPFKSSTTIRFVLPQPGQVELKVLDTSGRLVRTLEAGELPAGPHDASWDGRDEHGSPLSSGVYFCVLRAGARTFEQRLVLVR